MSEAGTNIVLAWLAGVLVGVDLEQGTVQLILVGSALTVTTLLYYRWFVSPEEKDQ